MRLRPGQVRDEIIAFLKSHAAGASTSEIQAAVVEALGQEVPSSSVRSYLNLNTPGVFERVGYGRYKLASGSRV